MFKASVTEAMAKSGGLKVIGASRAGNPQTLNIVVATSGKGGH